MRIEMFTEDELLPLSALQHLLFCERQCALIHIEQAWTENVYTAEGRILHERVDAGRNESRGDVRVVSGVPLRSLRLGLVGKADVVEFHREAGQERGQAPLWRPFPVEYKRGRKKKQDWDQVQLCAQALCLEEMLGLDVCEGALFYGKTRRRQSVPLDAGLRQKTEQTAARLHRLIEQGSTPPPVYTKACESCSFLESCLPVTLTSGRTVRKYLKEVIDSL